MELIADILMGAGALGAAVYCVVLARRLNRFNQLENGMGGAIAVLSAQVDDMTKALERARIAATESSNGLADLTDRAGQAAQRLELLLASLHDLPEPDRGGHQEQASRKVTVLRRRARHTGMEAAE